MKHHDTHTRRAVFDLMRDNPEMTVREAVFYVLNNGVMLSRPPSVQTLSGM